jgi:hypothetical protein
MTNEQIIVIAKQYGQAVPGGMSDAGVYLIAGAIGFGVRMALREALFAAKMKGCCRCTAERIEDMIPADPNHEAAAAEATRALMAKIAK